MCIGKHQRTQLAHVEAEMTLLKNASETVRGELEVANRELGRYKKAHGKGVGSQKSYDKDYGTELHDLRVTVQTLRYANVNQVSFAP